MAQGPPSQKSITTRGQGHVFNFDQNQNNKKYPVFMNQSQTIGAPIYLGHDLKDGTSTLSDAMNRSKRKSSAEKLQKIPIEEF